MFSLLRLIVWLVGVATILFFGLRYFGYETDLGYWKEQRTRCLKEFDDCRKIFIREGTEGLRDHCRPECLTDPSTLLKKSVGETR